MGISYKHLVLLKPGEIKVTPRSKAQLCFRNANSSFIQGRLQRAPVKHVLSSDTVLWVFICSQTLRHSECSSRTYGDSFYFRRKLKILGDNQSEHNRDSYFILFKINGALRDQRNLKCYLTTTGSPRGDCGGSVQVLQVPPYLAQLTDSSKAALW